MNSLVRLVFCSALVLVAGATAHATEVTGDALKIGWGNSAPEDGNAAIGWQNVIDATSSDTLVVGKENDVTNTSGPVFVFGEYNLVDGGTNIFLSGYGNTGTGTDNIALGGYNYLRGSGNVLIGRNNAVADALDEGTVGLGHGLVTDADNRLVLGRNNDRTTEVGEETRVLVVGNGTGDPATPPERSNAVVVYANGDVSVAGMALFAQVPGDVLLGTFTAE